MSDAIAARQPVTIRCETSLADPDTCKFSTSQILYHGAPFFFSNKENAIGSPLGERLFALSGVLNVLIAENIITISKEADAKWSELKPRIGKAIRSHLLSGIPAILEMEVNTNMQGRSDAELGVVIQQLLDKEVNRSIANHGGKISIIEVRLGKLFIAMGGGCQGCSSSQMTLRQGLEVMVKKVAPEIVEIVDMTDHTAGANPFYQSHK
tara:strand:+ start:411 stop:1037 length:627 start_codon:yes stop_codon:yes gene_type:complete